MSETVVQLLKHLDSGFEIDDEAEDEELLRENPDAYHKRELDKQCYEWELICAAKRRPNKA